MNGARPDGCAPRRLGILARGASRRSWAAAGGTRMGLRDIVRDYALETLADEDAVLVIDETGFLKQGKASCGVARQYYGLGGQDHQLPDRRVCVLCFASRPCLHRPGALSAEGVDGRFRTDDGGACAG